MSVKVMGAVWDLSLPQNEKLVALAYADHAEHDGSRVYPSVETIGRKTGYSRRSVQRITRRLIERGVLVEDGFGPRGTNRFRMPLHLWGDKMTPPMAGGATPDVEGATPDAPEGAAAVTPDSSSKPSNDSSLKAPAPKKQRGSAPLAVEVFRIYAHRYPRKQLYGSIERIVGARPLAWARIVKDWVARGYNPANVSGMLDAFKNQANAQLDPNSPDYDVAADVAAYRAKTKGGSP